MDDKPLSFGTYRIELFGGLRVRSATQTIEQFPTQKTGALLAFLAFYRSRRHSRETLTTLLWPDADPAAARDRLSQALVWLRPQLEPTGVTRGTVLLADRLSVGVDPGAVTTDVAEFQAALGAARREASPPARAASLERAVESYQGELLAGQYADWILTERRQLTEDYLNALAQLIGFHEGVSAYDRALDFSRRALTADPLREEAHGDLIRLLAATGQTAAALRQYEELRSTLAKALNSEPSPALRELAARVRSEAQRESAADIPKPVLTVQSAPSIQPVRPTAQRPLATAPVPVPITRLFGREAEIERVCHLLQTGGVRLVTLTGTGGAGKTRLALAVAAQSASAFAGAVAFVPLADLNDVQRIPLAIVEALRVTVAPGESLPARIAERLAATPYLLVLDNLEHLLPQATPILRDLLERTPTLTILTTSRQRLGLDGEREAPVASLPQPSASDSVEQIRQSPSVQLFVERAQAVRPDFAVTPANAALVARLCARLDGIPLAIELCAAWAQTLTPGQMLEKLDQRFDLLISRRTDITPRHRTLRAALEYGYLQLPPHLQTLFTRLSLFRGGWSLEAADAVCGSGGGTGAFAMVADLTELRERSLIVAEEVDAGETQTEMRYRMLETLREFAGEQVTYADRASLRRVGAVYFLFFAERSATVTDSKEQKRYLLRLDRERENLRAALGWCLEAGESELGLRLAGALSWCWTMHGPLEEDRQRLRNLLERAEASNDAASISPISPGVLSKGWRTFGHLAWSQSDYATARIAHERALILRRAAGDEAAITESLYYLGITAYRQNDYWAARDFLEESLTLSRSRNEPAGISRVLLNLGNLAYEEGNFGEARDFIQQSIAIERTLNNQQRVADALNNLGLLIQQERDYPQAASLFEEALGLYRALTNNSGATFVIANLGTVRRLQNDIARAGVLLREGLKLAFELGNRYVMIHYLLQLGMAEAAEKRAARSAFLIAAAHQVSETVGVNRSLTDADGYAESVKADRERLGVEAFERAWKLGKNASLARAVALALDVSEELDSRGA